MENPLIPSKRQHDWSINDQNVSGKLQKAAVLNPPTQSSIGVVFRFLCPNSRTGSLIGKGGSIVSQICQETGSKVRVEEAILGCDERVVVICDPDKETEVSDDQNKVDDGDKDHVAEDGDNEQLCEEKEPLSDDVSKLVRGSAVLKALLFLFDKMIEVETNKGAEKDENGKSYPVVFRLLVPSIKVGSLLGKGGRVVKQMMAESGAQIRVLPRDKLPSCAAASEELAQVTGEVSSVRKALQAIFGQLFENTHLPGLPSNPVGYPPTEPDVASLPLYSVPSWGSHAAGPRGFHENVAPGRMNFVPDSLSFRLLCNDLRVGGVIGKAGSIIKSLQQETGCDIKVLEGVSNSEDRVVFISGLVHPDEVISAPQDAVLRVQTRISRAISDGKEKSVPGRLVVSPTQASFLLGKGIMAEMRMLTGSNIRILGKEMIPKCVPENEDVVQVTGEYEAIQEALLQLTTRLRHHAFRDGFPALDHTSNPPFLDQIPTFPPYMGKKELSSPFHSFRNLDGMSGLSPHVGFHPHEDHSPFMHNIHRPGQPPHLSERKPWGPMGLLENGPPMGFADFAGLPRRSFGGAKNPAIITNTTLEVVVPHSVVPIICGEDDACLKQIREISDAKVTITESKPGMSETVIIISGMPEQTHAAQSLIQAFVLSEKESG